MADFTHGERRTLVYSLKLPSNAAEVFKMLDMCYNHFIDEHGEKPKEDEIKVVMEMGDMNEMYLRAWFEGVKQ